MSVHIEVILKKQNKTNKKTTNESLLINLTVNMYLTTSES